MSSRNISTQRSSHATAIGAEQSQRGPAKSLASPIAQALQAAPAAEFPRVHAARAELLSGEGIERFEWAVDALIVGVLSNRRLSKRARRESRERDADREVRRRWG